MKFRRSYRRASTSVILTITVATVFTLRSFAAPETGRTTGDSTAQDCKGTLTAIAEQVSVDGNVVKTGATVMSGSVITTCFHAKAIIDFGALGRVELGNN